MNTQSLLALPILLCLVAAVGWAQNPPSRTAQDHFDEGVRLINEEEHSQALAAFRESLRLRPQQPEAHGNIGSLLLKLNRPEEAVAAFREGIRLKPGDGLFHSGLCVALSAARKHSEAVTVCEEGVRLTPRSVDVRLNLLTTLMHAGRPDIEILNSIHGALANFADSVRLKEFAALYAMKTGRPESAVPFWEDLARTNPNSSYYHAQLAIVLLLVEREAEALGFAKKALELDSQNPYAHYFMGKLFLELGQHGDAVAALRKASAARPEIPSAQYNLAVSLSRLGRNDLAIDAFREAIALEPDGFRVHYEFGRLLSGVGRYEDAIEPHRKALALRPKDFEAKVGLGLVLFESTNFEEAIKRLEDAQREKPGNEVVAMFLRVTRARQQGIPQIDEMKRYARANPTNVNIRVDLIRLLSFARRIDEVEPFVKEFLDLKPKDIRSYQGVAVAYTTAGHPEKALEVYLKSLEIGEDAGTYFGLASIFAESGRNDEAASAWAKGFALRSDVPGFLTLYGHHLRDVGKRREALEAFKRVLALQPMNEAALANAAILSGRLGDMDAAKIYIFTLGSADPKLARRIERCLPYLRTWL